MTNNTKYTKCPWCKETTPDREWEDASFWCDRCGEHAGVECPKCGARFDLVYDNLEHPDFHNRLHDILVRWLQ